MNAPTRRKFQLTSIFAGIFVLLILIGYAMASQIDGASLILAEMRHLPPTAGYAAFLLALILAVVSGVVPLSALAMASGVLYGIWLGFVISGIGISVGAALAFAISRHWLRRPLSKWVSRYISMAALDHNILLRGWQLALLLRISPVAPFGVISYAFGLSSVTFPQFLIGLLGSFPAMLVYVYSGAVSGEMLRAFLSGDPQIDCLRLVLLVSGFVATVAAVFLLTRIVRDTLAEAKNYPSCESSLSPQTEPFVMDAETVELQEEANGVPIL